MNVRSRVSSLSFKPLSRGGADYNFKFIILGDSGVGKSCILERFVDGSFCDDSPGTVGIDFRIKTINIRDLCVKIQIWDAAGHDSFRSITSAYLRGAHCVFLVYDVCNKQSFQNLYLWLDLVRKHLNLEYHPVLVLGNKCEPDRERTVSREVATSWCLDNNLVHMDVSARTEFNVTRAFMNATIIMIARHYRKNTRDVQQIQQGWLQKKGDDMLGRFKNRYFVLRSDGKLYYGSKEYSEEEAEDWLTKVHGSISIDEIESVHSVSDSKRKFGINICCPKRTYILNATDLRAQKIWIQSINRATEPLMGAVIRYSTPEQGHQLEIPSDDESPPSDDDSSPAQQDQPQVVRELDCLSNIVTDAVIVDYDSNEELSHKVLCFSSDVMAVEEEKENSGPAQGATDGESGPHHQVATGGTAAAKKAPAVAGGTFLPQEQLDWVKIDVEDMTFMDKRKLKMPFEFVVGAQKKAMSDDDLDLWDGDNSSNVSPLVNVRSRKALKQIISAVLTSDIASLKPYLARPNADELINSADAFGNYPILLAAAAGLPDPVKLLISARANVNCRGKSDWTPLHWAAMKGDERIVKYLARAGANVDCKNEDGDTALCFATDSREAGVAKLLLASQADINLRNNAKVSPFDIAFKQISEENDGRVFHELAKYFSFPEPKYIQYCDISFRERISETSFASIYRCDLAVGNTGGDLNPISVPVACKIPKGRARFVGSDAWNEVRILCRMPRHENVINFLGVCMDFQPYEDLDASCAIVTPFRFGNSLRKYMRNVSREDRCIRWKQMIEFGIDITRGIQHMHKNGFKHCDISARNILLSEPENIYNDMGLGQQTLLINDFALARPKDSPLRPPLLPWRYCAPETLVAQVTDTTTDIFMLGITFWEILLKCSHVPFHWCTTPKEIIAYCEKHDEISPFESLKIMDSHEEKEWTQLISRCCMYSRNKRLAIDDVLEDLKRMRLVEEDVRVRSEGEGRQRHEEDSKEVDAKEVDDLKLSEGYLDIEVHDDDTLLLSPISEESAIRDSIPELEESFRTDNSFDEDYYHHTYVMFGPDNISNSQADIQHVKYINLKNAILDPVREENVRNASSSVHSSFHDGPQDVEMNEIKEVGGEQDVPRLEQRFCKNCGLESQTSVNTQSHNFTEKFCACVQEQENTNGKKLIAFDLPLSQPTSDDESSPNRPLQSSPNRFLPSTATMSSDAKDEEIKRLRLKVQGLEALVRSLKNEKESIESAMNEVLGKL